MSDGAMKLYWQKVLKPWCLAITGALVCWGICGLLWWLGISGLNILRGVL